MLKEILISLGIEMRRNRFLYKNYLYPLHVVVFEGKEWGHFNPSYFQIGLNRRLISQAKDSVIKDILKHELAHYLTHIRHGAVQPHGIEFKNICRELNFPDDISHATMNLQEENLAREGDIHCEKIIEKVKKLLQLAQSSNTHEAELATIKANQILLRHNLDTIRTDDDPLYMDRILMRTRKDSKLQAIYDILRHFVVRPIISQGKNACCLEVSGTLTNVKLARYVAEFLDQELEYLWKRASSEHALKGLRAKNSFYLGVARGFDEKMKSSKQTFSQSDKMALIVVEKQLNEKVRALYRGLRHTTSDHESDSFANSVGGEYGKHLNIRQGVESTNKGLTLSYNGDRS